MPMPMPMSWFAVYLALAWFIRASMILVILHRQLAPAHRWPGWASFSFTPTSA